MKSIFAAFAFTLIIISTNNCWALVYTPTQQDTTAVQNATQVISPTILRKVDAFLQKTYPAMTPETVWSVDSSGYHRHYEQPKTFLGITLPQTMYIDLTWDGSIRVNSRVVGQWDRL